MHKKNASLRLLTSLKKYRFSVYITIFLAAVSALLSVFSPKILGDITTMATTSLSNTGSIEWQPIYRSINLLIVLYLVSSLLNYFQSIIIGIMTAKYTKDLREQIINKISHLPASYFDKHQYGDTLSRMSNDVDVVASSLSEDLSETITSLVTVIGIFTMMLLISVPLSSIALVAIPISLIFVSFVAKKAQKYFALERTSLGKLNNHIEEDYSGQIIIKFNSREDLSLKEFSKVNERLYNEGWKSSFLARLAFPLTHIFTNLSYIAICILGGHFVIAGKLAIGSIQAFIQYVSQFNRPLTSIAEIIPAIQQTLAAAERIFSFLDEPEEEPDLEDSKTIKKVRGAVEFNDVCFSYDKKKPIISHFSAKIEPGMQVAIVGPTGAGKTTMINLLMRFYDPDSGYITIDGVPTRDMKRSDVRKMFGMVLQDTWLFSGSIADNLKYGKRSATMDEIKAAAKNSDVDHFIESLDKGYDTQISEDSDNISAGEKQLFTIARAIVAEPQMIILDEATSNVDTRTERLIQSAFEKLMSGRTSFVIAHRLSTIINSDLILVMKDGNIVEQGTHETLLKQNGFYAELYNSQFAD